MEMEYMLLIMSRLRTMGLTADQIDQVLPQLVQAIEVNKVSLKEFREIGKRVRIYEQKRITEINNFGFIIIVHG